MATINCLVTNILSNILFCVQQKKETQQVWYNMMMSIFELSHICRRFGENTSDTNLVVALLRVLSMGVASA